MERKIIITEDGSHTVSIPEMGVTYHSIHGAIQESMHVFIDAGFKHLINKFRSNRLNILDVGFGTGLNALLTVIEAEKLETSIYYSALEPFPISKEEANSMNYCERLERNDLQEDFIRMHECKWNKSLVMTENMLLHKSNHTLQTFERKEKFNLIYFDAFDPNAQPELWTKEIFEKLFSILEPNGVLVTYSSKGNVRRALQSAGFVVEKIPGPKGKREMVRAKK